MIQRSVRSRRSARRIWPALALGLLIGEIARPAWGQQDRPGEAPPTRAEVNQLQNDLREQRQLILQMMQTEQQRYDLLLQLLQGRGVAAPISAAPPGSTPTGLLGAEPAADAKRSAAAVPERRAAASGPTSITGKVTMTGGASEHVYVYVENVKMPIARHRILEIKQEGRQFSPRVAVVQTGTNLVFPNMDAVYHNVFSNSPRNTFDLGTYSAGDKPRSVMVTGPGVVDIFCNIHQRMSAKVLVVPSVLFTKVRPDGSFRIDNVPTGLRRVVAWSPDAKPEAQKVSVNGPTEVSFTLAHEDAAAHPNKFGQAYGSYRD
jgi:plastocyanin